MKLPPGVYPYRDDRFKAQPSIGGKSCYLGIFDTAEAAIAEVESAKRVYAERSAERAKNTFRAWAEDWLDERETSGAHRAADTDRSRMRRHVLGAEWTSLPLRAIRKHHLRTWLHELERVKAVEVGERGEHVATDRAISPQTVRHVCNLVRKCFADAVEAGKLSESPATNLRPRRTSKPERAIHLTLEQINALLEVPELPLRIATIYAVAIYTGLRAGELWALAWDDVHEESERPELVVRASHRGPTKTGEVRHVPLLPPAQAALKAWRAATRAADCPLVFPAGEKGHGRGWSGWHQAGKGYDAQWSIWAGHAGIDTARVKFRHLRHTCGAHLAAGSWGPALTLYLVAAWLGHADSRTTEQHYAHLTPEALHGARERLARSMLDPDRS